MSRIKEAFDSRFPNGVILNTDLSSAEVIALAILSNDANLIEDILSGRDMHKHFASLLFNITMEQVTKAQRTLVKKFTFALQYGSGAKGLAAKNGTTVEVAQKFIDNYYGRYQGVAKWQAMVAEEVQKSRIMTDRKGKAGYPLGMGQFESVTGRVYTFWEQESKWGNPSFKPTEMKNYPVNLAA